MSNACGVNEGEVSVVGQFEFFISEKELTLLISLPTIEKFSATFPRPRIKGYDQDGC